MSDKD
jgi:PadR family transcriptional regulator PadR